MTGRSLDVLEPGPLALVEDLGRIGFAALGVSRSGAADPHAFALANRLVGNPPDFAALELTLGGARLRAYGELLVAVTGAPASVHANGREEPMNSSLCLRDGAELAVGTPPVGLRTYLAVRGGVAVPPVLGSRSRDVLAELGPPPLRRGDRLPIGAPSGDLPPVDFAPLARPAEETVTVRLLPGPRDDWLTRQAWSDLRTLAYEVTAESNRIGLRLSGRALERARTDELPSEGVVPGAVQVPPAGQPVLFLVDHPATGGYPVAGVVVADDLPALGQVRPGQHVRFSVLNEEAQL